MHDWEKAANQNRDKIFRKIMGIDKSPPRHEEEDIPDILPFEERRKIAAKLIPKAQKIINEQKQSALNFDIPELDPEITNDEEDPFLMGDFFET